MTEFRSTGPEAKSPVIALPAWSVWGVTAAVALLLRLIHLFDASQGVFFRAPLGEAAMYEWWGRGGARFLHEDTSYLHAPLQAWWLGALHAMGVGDFGERLAAVLLSTLSVALVADLGRRLAGPLAGLAGGLLLAFHWPSLFFTVDPVPATLLTFLLVFAVWALVRADLDGKPIWAQIGAAGIGVASMADPIALFLVLVPVALALGPWRRRGGPMAGVRGALVLGMLVLTPGLALGVRNAVVGDRFVLVSDDLALDAYRGFHAGADGFHHALPGQRIESLPVADGALLYVAGQSAREVDGADAGAWFARASLARWLDAPGSSLLGVLRHARLLLGAVERPGDVEVGWWRQQSGFLAWPIFVGWGALLALGLVGMLVAPRRAGFAPLFLAMGTVAVVLLFLVVNAQSRLPLATLLAVPAGVPVALAYQAVRAGRIRVAMPLVFGVLAIGAISGLDAWAGQRPAAVVQAWGWLEEGQMRLEQRRWTQALPLFRDAVAVGGEHEDAPLEWEARIGMVRALLHTPMFEQAEQHLAVLEAIDPEDLELRALRGRAYLHRHDLVRATPMFDRVLESNPMQFDARRGRAWVFMQNKAFRAAQVEFAALARYQPEDPELLAGLGAAEMDGNGNEGRAKRLFWRALELDWETPVAHQYLGSLARGNRRIPEMLYHLRESLRLDPYNDGVRRFLVRTGAGLEHTPDVPRPENPYLADDASR